MKNVKTVIRDLTFNKVVIFLFLIVYIGLYYQKYAILISCSYILLGCSFFYNIVKHKKLTHSNFIVLCIIFLVYSFLSTLWSESFENSYNAVIRLSKSVIVSICFITLIDTKEHFKWALSIISFSGVIYAMLYLSNVDISTLGASRIMAEGDFLPNVNIVGLIICFSFGYYIFMYFYSKNYFYLCIACLAFVITFFLGSRKSIISLFICVFMMFFKIEGKQKLKIFFLLFILIALLFYYVPTEYLSFISDRLAQLTFLSSKISEIDSSDETRIHLLEYGFKYCMEKPFVGHGYFMFSQLFGKDCGVVLYSHNNYIETFVGGGIVGFVIYYALYFKIYNNIDLRNTHFDCGYLLFILLVVLLFNHFSIVVLQERFIWVLLAILFSGSYYYKFRLI